MRLLLTISLFLLTLSAFSQTGNFDYLTSNRRFTLAGRTVKGISNDTALLTASADSLVTQYAIRGYIDQRLLNTPDSSYIFDPEQFIVNGWNVSIRFPQDPGEPLFTGSPAYNLTQAHIDFLDSLMLALRDSNYTYFDDRDFYNDGTAALPFRIVRYDNHYIDSLFASISSGGGGGGPYHLPYNADTSYYLGGDSALHKLPAGVLSVPPYHLPYNNDTTYVLAGDSTLHKLPTYTPFDSTSISSRINQKQNKIKLTTLGQTGASTLINDTLNIPNYFFATNDSTDYSFSSMTAIYSEAGPGEATIGSSGVTANKDNLNFPFKQLKALDVGGWNAGDYVSFSWPTAKNSTSYTFLRGFVRLKQAVPIIQSLSFQFFNSGVAVSQILSMVNYGLDKSKVDVYQNITIPMSAFGFNTNGFDEIRLIFGGGSSASGLYLDLFQFQNATVEENKYVTDIFRSPGTTNVYEVLGGQNKLAFTDSIGTPVDTTSLSNRINLKLNATDTASLSSRINLKEPIIAAGTTSQYWRGDKTWQTLNTDAVTEATNKYYTDTKARAALTLTTTGTSGAASYDNSTGVLNVPQYTGQRFGIEDNTGVANRSLAMNNTGLTLNDASGFTVRTRASANSGIAKSKSNLVVGSIISLVSYDSLTNGTGNGSTQFINITPRYIRFNTDVSSVPPKIVVSSTDSLNVTSPNRIAVWDNDTLKSAAIASIGTGGGGTTSVGTITWLGTAYNINSGNNITLATPTTSDISEGSNLYFTNARARAAISVTGGGTYDNTTGVINITGGTTTGLSSTFGAQGSVLFRGISGVSQSNSSFFYDSTNSQLKVTALQSSGLVTPLRVTGNVPSGALGNVVSLDLRNTNATSNKTGIYMGGSTTARTFVVGTDIKASGTTDFYVYNGRDNTTPLYIDSAGKIAIDNRLSPGASSTDPASAWLTLRGSSDGSANSAALKLISGTLLTTPETGAIEFNGTHYYGTIGSTRLQLDQQSVAVGGANTQIQYNNSGVIAGSPNLSWNNTSKILLLGSGGTTVVQPLVRFNYSTATNDGGDFGGQLNGVEQYSIGFNSGGAFAGTANTSSGRTIYYYDRVAAVYRYGLDANGTHWYGTGATNYTLKVLTPTSGFAAGTVIASHGVTFPKMTSTVRDGITGANLTEGLTIYNTTTHQNETYNGTTWAH